MELDFEGFILLNIEQEVIGGELLDTNPTEYEFYPKNECNKLA